MVKWLKLVGLGIVAAIGYGIALDNVTARICVEYFTIGHAPIFKTESPTILAFGWGVLATWWVGLGLGIFLACVARWGTRPRLVATDLLRPLAILLATMGVLSILAGLSGFLAARQGWIFLVGSLARDVPIEKHQAFLADLWAHLMAYGSAFLGGMVLAIWVTFRRVQLARVSPSSASMKA